MISGTFPKSIVHFQSTIFTPSISDITAHEKKTGNLSKKHFQALPQKTLRLKISCLI